MDRVTYLVKNMLIDTPIEDLVNNRIKSLGDVDIIDIKFQADAALMSAIVQIHYRTKEV